jgi:hypothetical protein
MDIGDIPLSPTPNLPVRHPYIELKGDIKLDQIIVDPKRGTQNWGTSSH